MVKFRTYVLSSGLSVIGGKNAENNDELVWQAGPNDILLHTQSPGSPFVNVGELPSKAEINEAAIFTAKYSQEIKADCYAPDAGSAVGKAKELLNITS